MFSNVFQALESAVSSTVFQVEFAILLIVSLYVAYRLRSVPPVRRFKHCQEE